MSFKFKKKRIRYDGYSALELQEGTIVKVVVSPDNNDNGGIIVRTKEMKRPFKQLVSTKYSLIKGHYWGETLFDYIFEVLEGKKESDY